MFLLAACFFSSSAVSEPVSTHATEGKPLERTALVFGQRIHYLESGAGPTIILVHGLGDDAGIWRAIIAPLARRYHVIALDQIGFGRSDKPLLNYRAETLVDFLQEFQRTLHIPRAILVGNSLGGWVAALFTIHHPERVEKLVLIDSAGMSALTDALGADVRRALRLATLEDLKILGPLTFSDPRYYEPEDALRESFAERIAAGDSYTVGRIVDSLERREDTLDDHLKEITARTFIVWGREDRLIPLRFGEYLQHTIRGARLAVIDHCGHEPQVECPQALEKVLATFLGK